MYRDTAANNQAITMDFPSHAQAASDNESDFLATQEEIILKDSDTLLVETVFHYPALYDKELKDYHDGVVRQNCWTLISQILNKPVCDCQKRWQQLRDSFTSERRRREKDERSGSGPSKRKGFSLYNDMAYLHRHIKRKKTFTNVLSNSTTTTSTLSRPRPQVMDMQRFFPPVPPLPIHPLTMAESTMTYLSETSEPIMPRKHCGTTIDLVCSFLPIPSLNMVTPPPESNIASFSSFPSTPPSNTSTPPLASDTESPSFPTLPTPPTSTSSPPPPELTPDYESSVPRAISSPKARFGVTESSLFVNNLPCPETSSNSRFGKDMRALSSPPSRISTPTRSCRQASPRSPHSPNSDTSYSYYMDDSTQSSISSSNVVRQNLTTPGPSKSCYTTDNRRTKKVDPVEKSFLALTTSIQAHLAGKSNVEQTEKKNTATADSEDSFGILIASELRKMDTETKKKAKSRILQILYE